MTQQQELDRRVTEWLAAEAPSRAAPRVLTGALERVAQVGQGRPGRPWARSSADGMRIMRWAVVAALVAAVVAGAVGVGAWLLRGSSPLPVAAANGWIAFTEAGPTRQDKGHLLLVRDGAEAHTLTGPDGSPAWASCATFSPDGSRLAYLEWLEARSTGDGRPVILAIDGDGLPAGPRVELPARAVTACPRWSPDGDAIVFAGVDGLVEGRMDGSIRPINGWRNRSTTVSALDWSPDGTALLVTAADGIWIVPTDGAEAGPLAVPAAGEDLRWGITMPGARWSADGRIAYPVLREAVPSIRVQSASGETPPVDLVGDAPFAWSPDGRRIAWIRADGPSGGAEVVVGIGDGDAPLVKARFEAPVRALAWSPDGAWLVVAVDPGGPTGRLIAIPMAGDGEPALLTEGSHLLEWTTSEDLSWQASRP